MHEPDLIVDAQQRARGKDQLREIAEELKQQYQTIRRDRIEEEILKPLAGIESFAEYHQKQRSLYEGLVVDLNERIENYDVGLTIVLAGVDSQGHVGLIENPGVFQSWDGVGYASSGMGDRHASIVFAWYRYTRAIPVNEALYIAFEAKKKSETAGGVDKATDILIVRQSGIEEVQPATIQELETIYNEREEQGQRARFDKKITDLKIESTAIKTP